MSDDRADPPLAADERATLIGFLDWHRETLVHKCAGLSAYDLRRQAASPSSLSLLGLVRHLAEVERFWFRRVLAAEDIGLIYSSSGDFQAAYDATAADAETAFANLKSEVDLARLIERDIPNLEVTGRHPRVGEDMSLRWILVHMIEEYARHNGHADLIREAIDGTVGE